MMHRWDLARLFWGFGSYQIYVNLKPLVFPNCRYAAQVALN